MEFTDEFEAWWDELPEREQGAIAERVDLLARRGPALKRPVVGEIKASRHHPRMKELIVEEGAASIRILFAFDPRRAALLLLGGDKAGNWRRWYVQNVPIADDLYDEHLNEINES
ncbi:MAG: type II toxin-antitoxin system RelE/ParE family toxin [Patulibacter sp.]